MYIDVAVFVEAGAQITHRRTEAHPVLSVVDHTVGDARLHLSDPAASRRLLDALNEALGSPLVERPPS